MARLRTYVCLAAGLALVAMAGLLAAPRAHADLTTFGASLTTTPTLNTANGADRVSQYKGTGPTVIPPDPHFADDLSIWNTQLASGTLAAPAAGQIRLVSIEGCAIEDHAAPSQLSQGVPVNTILFQALRPQNGAFLGGGISQSFLMPFCSNSSHPATGTVNTGTISRFATTHLCVQRGDLVSFHDIGGEVPNPDPNGRAFYAQGVPFEVIAKVRGSAMSSFEGNPQPGTYAPGGNGFEHEPGEQIEMRVTLGTGGDASGQCAGGTAQEAPNSNKVICDYGYPNPGHPFCTSAGVPATLPHLSQLRFGRTQLHAGEALGVRYFDPVSGTTTLTATRLVFGRQVGSACDPPTRRLRSHPSCHFFQPVHTVVHRDTAGRNRAALTTGGLAAGKYQLHMRAHFHGHASEIIVKTFRVL